MNTHKYKLKYEFNATPGEFTAEELKKEKIGGTDALLFFSCIYPEDGSLSTNHHSFDGRNDGKPMSSQEVFKMWMMLGMHLARQTDLDEFRRNLAKSPADAFFKSTKGHTGCTDPNCAVCDT